MSASSQPLIDGYLDETLSADEHAALTRWILESPENAEQFIEAMLLHDRLRGELCTHAAIGGRIVQVLPEQTRQSRLQRTRSWALVAGIAAAAVLLVAVFLNGPGDRTAAAAVVELDRVIAAQSNVQHGTYRIDAEEVVEPRRNRKHPAPPDRDRPPKPPLNGALLHVRGGGQFVLIRTTRDGQPFVTGSDGRTSWAVPPDGPVRISSDRTRFNRDVPGHEHSMSLLNIQEGLERLRDAYEVRLPATEMAAPGNEPRGVIEAVKRRGYRGPERVEIIYARESGLIRQMRFDEMPYGPERLSVRLTLTETKTLSDGFFDHAFHHDPNRPVEVED